jgi:ParB-like chromosome segregation protein Spo0J
LKLKFKDVLPNPYRDLKGNPLLKDKIAELVASINTTGFWDNVVVRKNKAGKYELSYGHHRVAAAIEAGLTEADFIVKDLSDALMIQIMDNENREAYQSSPASVIEAVKAVVAALAEGTIPAFEVDTNTRKDTIRFAPSYVAGKEPARTDEHPYTASLVSDFLGRSYNRERGGADTAVIAALNFLHLKELGAITNAVLVKDKQPISARKLFDITSDIKNRTEVIQERRGKSAEEIAKLNAQRLEAQAKAKAEEKKAEDARKVLIKAEADARRAENERKADALAAERKEKDKRAQEKEILNKLRMAELDAQLKAKKEWEASQQVQDAYLPIRRDVEAMLGKLETIVSERNPFREQVKSLATRKGITAVDKQRLRVAVVAVADWYNDWIAPQFAPELRAAQKRAVDTRKANQLRPKGKGGA